jgi:hypothetical protein
VIGFVVECAVALLLSSLHMKTVLAGVVSVTCGVAAYAWCGGFQQDLRRSRSRRMEAQGRGTVSSRSG